MKPLNGPGEDVVTTLYRQYITMVRRQALRIVGERTLAEDVAQEVFLNFMRYAADHDVQFAASLLYQMTTQTAVRRLRRWRRDVGVPTPDWTEHAGHTTQAMEETLALRKVLGLANPDQALIACYYYLDGMDQNEIAELTGVPRRTVGRQIERFCAFAQQVMKKDRSLSLALTRVAKETNG